MEKKIDLTGIRRIADRIADTVREADKAVERARGTLRRRIVPEARRDIQADYNLKAARITQGLTANNIDDGVELIGSKRGIGAIEFGGKWRRGHPVGATYSFKRGSPASPVPGAFIAPLLSGNNHIVSRQGPKREMTQGRYKGMKRQPLEVEYGPSIAQMLRRPGRAEHLADFAQTLLASEITRLLR